MKLIMKKIKSIAAVTLVALALLAGTNAPSRGPSPDDPDFGSGIFGEWITDEYGLPAYQYNMRHHDPRALWDPKTEPVTNLMWHQLGNDRVNANAYNLGFVKLFHDESGAMWLNEYEPEQGAHSGGFGWLIDGNTVLIDRDDLVPAKAEWERTFGVGYFKKRLGVVGLEMERVIFAPTHPSGMAPLLISEITIENLSASDKQLTLIEYWDVNTRLLTDVLMGRGMLQRRRDEKVSMTAGPGGSILVAEPKRIHGPDGGFPATPKLVDPELPAMFLASNDSKPDAWIIDPSELFEGARILVEPGRLKLAGSPRPDSARRPQKKACLAARLSLDLPAGATRTLRFEYGYEKGLAAEALAGVAYEAALEDSRLTIAPALKKVAASTILDWKKTMPSLTLPRDRYLARELQWDYYYLMSSTLYDGYYERRKIPQGANYLYYSGMDGATRDFAAFVQTATYYRPELAREILTFMARCQDPDGRLFYDIGGFGRRYNNPYRPGDLDIWFLWALGEYVLATRDFALLDRVEPFYPLHAGEKATMWEHARRSLDHLINVVGTGKNGHPKLRLSDWNDEMTFLTAGTNPIEVIATFVRGESVMNTAMCCVTLPLVAGLARERGDERTARDAEDYLARMRSALGSAWHDDHLIRSYSGLGEPFGQDETYLEPQAWALLAPGSLTPERESILVEKIKRELIEPSAQGMMISTSTSGSVTTRPGEQEEGGIWFAINGPAAVALARFDRELAWDEVKKNSLGWHAHSYPETWYGIWSGPDAWNSVFSDRPDQTWYMKTPIINTGPQMYPIQNAHAHSQTMWAIARLAGVEPVARGWRIDPRLPMDEYSFECALYSIEVTPARISGQIRLAVDASFELMVRRPDGWSMSEIGARVDGEVVEIAQEGDYMIVRVAVGPESTLTWEIGVGP